MIEHYEFDIWQFFRFLLTTGCSFFVIKFNRFQFCEIFDLLWWGVIQFVSFFREILFNWVLLKVIAISLIFFYKLSGKIQAIWLRKLQNVNFFGWGNILMWIGLWPMIINWSSSVLNLLYSFWNHRKKYSLKFWVNIWYLRFESPELYLSNQKLWFPKIIL